jgi:hypothetical protein
LSFEKYIHFKYKNCLTWLESFLFLFISFCFQFSPLPPLILPSSPIDKSLLISKGSFAVFSPSPSSSSQLSSPSPSQQWSPGSSKENLDPGSENESAAKKKRLSVIAQHRRLGEESLCRLKEDVRRFAVDHTFKETAKKFGIHHSTVSGWVKAGEQVFDKSDNKNLGSLWPFGVGG